MSFLFGVSCLLNEMEILFLLEISGWVRSGMLMQFSWIESSMDMG